MIYRENRRTGDRISTLGFGTGYIAGAGEKAITVLQRAYEGGINFYDLATASSATYGYMEKALGDVRKDIFLQVHFGNTYPNGEYAWTTDADTIKRQVEWDLHTLKTDYIDYGFIHCLDEVSDWEAYKKGGALEVLLEMQRQGIVRHIGLSSHTPATIQQIMDEQELDMLMFSLNPAYDYQKGEYGKGNVDERTALLRRCETIGTGITVMKPFAGGQLLDKNLSPFGEALTHYQCIQYALDRPGVLSVLPGMTTVEQVEYLLNFFNAPPEVRDYSIIASFKPADAAGKCVYCNHCQPCPEGLDVGLINKYYDLAKAGDPMAAQHYRSLTLGADSCIGCGHCNARCPFGVDQVAKMQEIAKYF